MPPDFKIYTASELSKINSQRRAISQPADRTLPVLQKAKVLFVAASQMNNEPASCANCQFYNFGRSCQFMGPGVMIRKFVYPPRATADAKRIEYWPCCGMHTYGIPNYGPEEWHKPFWSPGDVDLIWINAPAPGQEHGGANCGGACGGDDCDYFISEDDDMHADKPGFCRVLQSDVDSGDVCTAWDDDDKLEWTKAQALIKELDGNN